MTSAVALYCWNTAIRCLAIILILSLWKRRFRRPNSGCGNVQRGALKGLYVSFRSSRRSIFGLLSCALRWWYWKSKGYWTWRAGTSLAAEFQKEEVTGWFEKRTNSSITKSFWSRKFWWDSDSKKPGQLFRCDGKNGENHIRESGMFAISNNGEVVRKTEKVEWFSFSELEKVECFSTTPFLTIWKKSNIIENFRIGKSRAIIEIFLKWMFTNIITRYTRARCIYIWLVIVGCIPIQQKDFPPWLGGKIPFGCRKRYTARKEKGANEKWKIVNTGNWKRRSCKIR